LERSEKEKEKEKKKRETNFKNKKLLDILGKNCFIFLKVKVIFIKKN